MKKIMLLTLFILTFSLSVNAYDENITGKIYSTDICAYINGVEVHSYNIGGKTAVVIEDILKDSYTYCDDTRELKFYSLDPKSLVEYKTEEKQKPGKAIGNIYKTDIKTSIYDVVLPSYNIGGKTAVAIEDLGNDGVFSKIGGRYFWNEKDRTIHLEFMYDDWAIVPNNKSMKIVVNEDMTQADATFTENFHCLGGDIYTTFDKLNPENAYPDFIIPIKAQGELIGYYLRISISDIKYFYPEKLEKAAEVYTPHNIKTKEDVINHFVHIHSASSSPQQRFDTENYSFIYISVAGTSWTSYNLVQAFDDGTYIDYRDQINTINRSPHNLVIDEENEKVTFKYLDRYTPEWFTNYEIDLKTKTIKEIQ